MIQSFKTHVYIDKPLDELPTVREKEVTELKVFYEGHEIYREFAPSTYSIELAKAVEVVPGLTVSLLEEESYSNYLALPGGNVLVTNAPGGMSKVTVSTWGSSEEEHYKKVDKLVEALRDAGFPVESGECYVTMVRRC